MFTEEENHNYYIAATKDALVNHTDDQEREYSYNKLFTIFLLFLVIYLSYNYLQKEHLFFKKTAVMGVTYSSDTESNQLEAILSKVKADSIHEEIDQEELSTIINSTTTNDSTYIASLKKEIDTDKSSDITIVVQDGDTLRSLAERYYGSSMEYKKILQDNPNINGESHKIYAGQIIRLDY